MAEYSFLSVWELEAPIEAVWAEISRPEGYPSWFRFITSATLIEPGDEAGVGAFTRSLWKTALPYGFVIDTRATRSESPQLLELAASGDLAGTGRWDLSMDGPVTTVRYTWIVRTTKPWMDFMAPIARPAFAWNHGVIMRAGGAGLAAKLGVRLLRNQSFTEESASPFGAIAATGGTIAFAILAVRILLRLAGRR